MKKEILEKRLKDNNLYLNIGSDIELVDKADNSIILEFENPEDDNEISDSLKEAFRFQIKQDSEIIKNQKKDTKDEDLINSEYVKLLRGLRKKIFGKTK